MPSNKRGRAEPSGSAPATFNLCYDGAENCPGNPYPVDGVRTLVGPMSCRTPTFGRQPAAWWVEALSRPDGKPLKEEESAPEYRVLVTALRRCGLTVLCDPKNKRPKGTSAAEDERIMFYECESPFLEELPIAKNASRQTVLEVADFFSNRDGAPWIRLKLLPRASAELEETLVQTLNSVGIGVVSLPHAHHFLQDVYVGNSRAEEDVYEFRVVHGEGEHQKPKGAPRLTHHDNQQDMFGSLFTFTHRASGKVVGKLLCAYQNSEMETAGPTLEIIEVATEWRGRSIGHDLLGFVKFYFEDMWEDYWERYLEPLYEEIRFSACNVTTRAVSEWFKRQGFRDDDGMGEEMSKQLLGFGDVEEGDESDEEEDGIVRCRGTTTQGTRCQITNERGESGWYYKARPLCQGSHYCGHHASQGH